MDKLIKELQTKGFITIKGMKLKGKATPVLHFISLMNYTDPYESDKDWWTLHAYTLAIDGGSAVMLG